jgi:hypothetical protein
MLTAFLLCLPLAWLGDSAPAGEKEDKKDLSFQSFNSYFESNKSGLTGESSYLVFTNKAAFGKVFQATPPVGGKKRTYLPADAFESGIVAAVVKRGNRVWTYKVTGVDFCKGKATVTYEAKAGPEGSATFASPLIVTVQSRESNRVVFVENGKEVSTVNVKE